MSIKVIKPGLLSTIQDKGRTEGMIHGVPISGAMDLHLFEFANLTLGNHKDSACIEFYQQGLKLRFKSSTVICVALLEGTVSLNSEKIDINSVIKVDDGDTLMIKEMTEGNWGYIAVKNGFISENLFGSQSYYKGLTPYQLKEKDSIGHETFNEEIAQSNSNFDFSHYDNQILTAYEGPEFYKLSQTLKFQIQNAVFSLSSSLNRMAYEIQERLDNELEEIVTGPVLPGTIQYTPEGKMIVLMRDAQVTGGYPRILQLTKKSINITSQMRPREKFKINLIEINSEKT